MAFRVRVTGTDAAVRTYRRFSGKNAQQRIATPALEAGADEFLKLARRRNFGFTDRTGRLRRSVRKLTGRGAGGRFVAALEVTAQTAYAAFVELKRRTKDRRAGPPYWFGRLLQRNRRTIDSAVEREARRRINHEARRL